MKNQNYLYTYIANNSELIKKEYNKSEFYYGTNNHYIEVSYKERNDVINLLSHYHLSYEIIYISDGEAVFKVGGKEYIASKNSIVFINPFEKHQIEVTKVPYKRYYLWFDNKYFYTCINYPEIFSILKHRPENFSHVITLSDIDGEKVKEIFDKILKEFNTQKLMWDLSVYILISRLLIYVYRCNPQQFPAQYNGDVTKIILDVQKYIEEHFIEDITLEHVEKLFYIDKYYFSKMFKTITSYNFKEYIIIHRLHKAKELLINTNRSIADISLDIGMNSSSSFIKLFKKYEKTSPLKYRKNYKNYIKSNYSYV